MAEKNLDLTFVRTINNRTGEYTNRKWLGSDSRNRYYYGLCVKGTIPSGVINSIKIGVKVVDFYSGIGNQYWTATYGVKISTTDVSDYDSGIIPDDAVDGILNLRIWGANNGAATAEGVITSGDLSKYSGKTVYFYIGTLSSTSATHYSAVQIYPGASDESIDLTKNTTITVDYIPYTAVISPSVIEDSTIHAPSDSLVINWNGAENGTNVTISSFTLVIRKMSASGTVLYTKTDINSSLKTLTIKISDFATQPTRGDILYATIQAIGNVNGYNGTINSAKIAVINSLPTAPEINTSGLLIDTATDITFTVTKGIDTDIGQTTSIKYKIGNSGALMSLTGSTLKLTLNDNLPAGYNTIYFYTNDGLENSTATALTFTVNYAPEFTSLSISYDKVASGLPNASPTLATVARINYELKRNISNPIFAFQVKTASTHSGLNSVTAKEVDISNYVTVNAQTHMIAIDIVSLSNSIIPYGYFFKFAIDVFDGVAHSGFSEFLLEGQKPGQCGTATINSIKNDKAIRGPKPYDNYFKNKVTFSLTNPDASAVRPDIQSVQVIATHSNGTITEQTLIHEGGTYSTQISLAAVSENDTVTFSVKVTDIAGQIAIATSPIKMIRSSNLQFVKETLSLSKSIIKPFSNKDDLIIIHPTAFASGTDTNAIQFAYSVQIKSARAEAPSFSTNVAGEQINTTILASIINSLLLDLVSDNNTSYTATIIVTAMDGFGTTRTLNKTIAVDFREAPVFVEASAFKIKHDFQIAPTIITSSSGTEVSPSLSSNSALRMFNAQEGIIFTLPKVTDYNNDVVEYQIFLARADFTGQVLDVSNMTFSSVPWLALSFDQLENGPSDNNYYYYRYPASWYTKNEQFYFRLRVKDSKDNYSEIVDSSTYIIGCRTIAPSFTVGEVFANRVGTTVILDYNLAITDLGGSATSSGWSEDFYNMYPNFERSISGYTPKIALKIEISSNPDFGSNDTMSITQTGTSPLLNFKSVHATFENFNSTNHKIFVRFILSVSYGLNSNNSDGLAVVTSIPLTHTHFGTVPTVSHRSHKVGINTNVFTDEDVFVIENYQGNRYITFRGTDANTTETYEIKIDLLTGSIDGATISGGTW